jgi:hypothetical protein
MLTGPKEEEEGSPYNIICCISFHNISKCGAESHSMISLCRHRVEAEIAPTYSKPGTKRWKLVSNRDPSV